MHMCSQSLAFFSDTLSVGVHGHIYPEGFHSYSHFDLEGVSAQTFDSGPPKQLNLMVSVQSEEFLLEVQSVKVFYIT